MSRAPEESDTPALALLEHLERAEALLLAEWDWLGLVGDEEAFGECRERLRAVSEALDWARARAA